MGSGSICRCFAPRRALSQLIMLGLLLAHLLMAYNAVKAATGADGFMPVAVLSGSMEPGFKRGDLLLFRKGGDGDAIRAGDVVLYKPTAYGDVPIVHRVIKVHERRDGGGDGGDIMTKGDNNGADDSAFYRGPWLHRDQVMAKAVGYLPNAGWFSVALGDKPVLRIVVVAVLGLAVLLF